MKLVYPSIFFSIISVNNIYAQDNYYNIYHPVDTTTTTTTTTSTTNNTDTTTSNFTGSSPYTGQSSLITADRNYVSNVIGSSDAGPTSDVSSKKSAYISIAYAIAENVRSRVIPIEVEITEHFSVSTSLSYIENDDTNEQGRGDTTIGFALNFGDDNNFGNIKTSFGLYLPTGDETKGLGSGVNAIIGTIAYTKNFPSTKSRFSISSSYSSQIEMSEVNINMGDLFSVDNIFYVKEGDIEYGDKSLMVFGYDQVYYDAIQLNFKYIWGDAKETKVSKVGQADELSFQDFSVGASVNFFDLASLSVGKIHPVNEQYGSGVTDVVKRRPMYYISLSSAF